jgi:hypothetical protein
MTAPPSRLAEGHELGQHDIAPIKLMDTIDGGRIVEISWTKLGAGVQKGTVQQFYAAISGPVPAAPRPEISTPPLIGREEWAKSESTRLAASLRPVIQDAAKGTVGSAPK